MDARSWDKSRENIAFVTACMDRHLEGAGLVGHGGAIGQGAVFEALASIFALYGREANGF